MTPIPPEQLVGSYRRFGPSGPAYKVLSVVRRLDDGDVLFKVRVPETREEVERRYSAVMRDPEEG